MSRTILVTGATGNQGGAVLESLVERIEDGSNNDIVIIALTRNATSPTAKRLAARSNSIRVLQGNMDDPDSVLSNAKEIAGTPVWSVFMVQSVIAGGVTAAQEEAQGKKFIDACIANEVNSLVYSSVDRGGDVGSPQDPTPVSVFASKHRIEQHLFRVAANTKTSWFVLRPTGLIEPTLRNELFGRVGRTGWKIYMEPGKPLQWVSCRDVGHFAAQGLLSPSQWAGKCLSLAGWEGTFAEGNAISKKITGEELTLTFGPFVRLLCGVVVKDLSLSYKWCNEKGFGADIEYLRRLHPGLLSFEDCLRRQEG